MAELLVILNQCNQDHIFYLSVYICDKEDAVIDPVVFQ